MYKIYAGTDKGLASIYGRQRIDDNGGMVTKVETLKKKLFYTFCVNLFLAFTILVFGPMEIFISNSADFQFIFADFWWMLSVFALGYLIISTVLVALLPDKLCEAVALFIFAFTLCCYIQTMFLNGKMQVLVGQEIEWGTGTILFNLFIWLCVFVIVFVAKHYLKEKGKKVFQFFSLAITAVQLVALISLLLTTDVLTEEKNSYVSNENMLELSSEKNVVVFILDFFDGRTMDAILAENAGFLDPLEGFTYYPNATSVHSRTYPSVTYMLTGNICYFDCKPQDYVNEAYEESNFIPTLCENGIEVGLYTFPGYIGDSAKTQICNYVFKKLELDFEEVIRVCGKMALYRDMPYIAKNRFKYDVSSINNRVVKDSVTDDSADIYQNFDDEWFARMLTENGLSMSEKDGCFRFYHLASAHTNLSDPYPYAIRSFEIVYEYLDKMREMGVFEDSMVIITTDHGSSGSGETLDMPHKTAVPILFVKPAGVSGGDMQISEAPVSHTEFIPTILDGFSLDHTDYGKAVYDIGETEDRERFYYYSALYSNEEGEVELREYKVDGDARKEENYHFTGNKWDIRYSYNIVAPK